MNKHTLLQLVEKWEYMAAQQCQDCSQLTGPVVNSEMAASEERGKRAALLECAEDMRTLINLLNVSKDSRAVKETYDTT